MSAAPGSLAALRPGQRARILGIQGRGPLVQRLHEMGLLEGEVVTFVKRAPLGDPLEIRLMGYALSLREEEASRIQVQAL